MYQADTPAEPGKGGATGFSESPRTDSSPEMAPHNRSGSSSVLRFVRPYLAGILLQHSSPIVDATARKLAILIYRMLRSGTPTRAPARHHSGEGGVICETRVMARFGKLPWEA
jgi:hypothetical protein